MNDGQNIKVNKEGISEAIMQNPTPKDIWNSNPSDLRMLLDTKALKPLSNTIRFYAPSFSYYHTKQYYSNVDAFPTISVTGNHCKLNCQHCGGKILETMHPTSSPADLFELSKQLKLAGAKGVLISGGCLLDGSVPLHEFTDALSRLICDLDLTVFVHTGIVNTHAASVLKKANVDAVLIDVIGSNNTIKHTLNLNVTVQDYAKSLQILEAINLKVVPHVIVGLNHGKLDGEYNALQIIANYKPAAVVIIAFMPIPGTRMAQTPPPQPLDIARTLATARALFPETPIALGCMRPKGQSRRQTDVYALKAGVDAIAFPSETAIDFAKEKCFNIEFSAYCCAQLCHEFDGVNFPKAFK